MASNCWVTAVGGGEVGGGNGDGRWTGGIEGTIFISGGGGDGEFSGPRITGRDQLGEAREVFRGAVAPVDEPIHRGAIVGLGGKGEVEGGALRGRGVAGEGDGAVEGVHGCSLRDGEEVLVSAVIVAAGDGDLVDSVSGISVVEGA